MDPILIVLLELS